MGKMVRVLIVEDDTLVALDLQQTLQKHGYEVVAIIDNGEEVLEKIEALAPDLILMDIMLKGKLDGIATVAQLPSQIVCPIIFLTGLSDEATLQRAKLARPYGYLIKPFDPLELHSTIQVALFRQEKNKPEGVAAIDTYYEQDLGISFSSGTNATLDFLQQIHLFQALSPEQIKSLAESAIIKSIAGGSLIVLEGSDKQLAFIPVSGRISITKTSEVGKDLIVALLAPGDILGCLFCLNNFKGCTSVRAQIDSKILVLNVASVRELMQEDLNFMSHFIEVLAAFLTASYQLASNLAHSRVEVRIINSLILLLPKFGRSTNHASDEASIYITRKELADLSGTSPETAIRITKHLEREGLLILTRPGIIKIPKVSALKSWNLDVQI